MSKQSNHEDVGGNFIILLYIWLLQILFYVILIGDYEDFCTYFYGCRHIIKLGKPMSAFIFFVLFFRFY